MRTALQKELKFAGIAFTGVEEGFGDGAPRMIASVIGGSHTVMSYNYKHSSTPLRPGATVRWTLPRLRIDQVMITCLKYLIPMSCFLFLGTILWPLLMYKMSDGGRTSFWAPKADRWAKPAVLVPVEDAETSQLILPNSTPVDTGELADVDRKVAGGTR